MISIFLMFTSKETFLRFSNSRPSVCKEDVITMTLAENTRQMIFISMKDTYHSMIVLSIVCSFSSGTTAHLMTPCFQFYFFHSSSMVWLSWRPYSFLVKNKKISLQFEPNRFLLFPLQIRFEQPRRWALLPKLISWMRLLFISYSDNTPV